MIDTTHNSGRDVFVSKLSFGYTLAVAKSGTGSGTVSSSPAGIICGTDCLEVYAVGTLVTLTATPDSGSVFTGWSGACTGTVTCTITIWIPTNLLQQFLTFNLYHLLQPNHRGKVPGQIIRGQAMHRDFKMLLASKMRQDFKEGKISGGDNEDKSSN